MADTLYGVELQKRSEVRTGSLVVIAGEAADVGTHVLVREEVVLGRVPGGLELRDGRASRRHARVFVEAGETFAEDLGSTNGTSLNGHRLEAPTALADGDRIQIGSTVVKYTLVDETEAAWLERMARLAGTDPLTGLHAKHRFDNLLEQALRAARMSGGVVTVLMMDLDGVKAVNDTHGHRYGAALISGVGHAIGRLLAGRGESCRFGGDEFCAYLPGQSLEVGLQTAEAIRSMVQDLVVELDGVSVHATISIGAHRVGDDTPAEAVAAADRALYRAKAAGRNRVST